MHADAATRTRTKRHVHAATRTRPADAVAMVREDRKWYISFLHPCPCRNPSCAAIHLLHRLPRLLPRFVDPKLRPLIELKSIEIYFVVIP